MISEKEYSNKTIELSADVADVKCSKCNRTLRSPTEWVGVLEYPLCEDCYKYLVFYSNIPYE
jgi:NAD-dependent SIR2 family protein deacetylase